MNKRLITPVAGVLMIALVIAGCGGGGNDEASGASISKAEFVKQANKVCVKTEEQLASGYEAFLASHKGKEPQGAALVDAQAELVETVMAPAKREEAEQLREIGAPSNDEDQVEAIAVALEEGAEEAENHPEKTIQSEANPFFKAKKLAVKYGLKSC